MGFDVANNDKNLLILVSQNSEAAFRQLFDLYWNKIYSVAFALTKSKMISEEIVQDVFLKVWTKRTELPALDNFDAFLFIVARNHIYNVLRKKSVEPVLSHPAPPCLDNAGPEQVFCAKETLQLVEQAVALLPDQQQAVFRLSRNEGLDYNTIALQLGISRSTVKNHMTKALRFLRQYLVARQQEVLMAAALVMLLS
jgi:RNA polymerase sigma-70 factor (family 1)